MMNFFIDSLANQKLLSNHFAIFSQVQINKIEMVVFMTNIRARYDLDKMPGPFGRKKRHKKDGQH